MKNCLHIYSQNDWHDQAYIVGTTEALQHLRSAIDKALSEGGGTATSYVNDGEGFYLAVVCVDDEKEFTKLAVPYVDEIAMAKSDEKGPWDMEIVKTLIQECYDKN